MIVETIVTSVDDQGRVNVAPMGPRVEGDLRNHQTHRICFTLRPFESSRTFLNLQQTRQAVIHLTDDAEIFARAAVDALGRDVVETLVERLDDTDWFILKDCHRWFAVEITSVSDQRPRAEMTCRIVRSEIVRPFGGLNRARHAVIEAAILATRTHLLSRQEVTDQLDGLQPLVDKTAGEREREAFELLRRSIHDRFAQR